MQLECEDIPKSVISGIQFDYKANNHQFYIPGTNFKNDCPSVSSLYDQNVRIALMS